MTKIAKKKAPPRALGFLGGGNMAEALLKGLASRKEFTLSVSDQSGERLAHLRAHYPVKTFAGNQDLVKSSEVVILAVKPPLVPAVLSEVRGELAGKLLISIAAGVPVAVLKSFAGKDARVIRVMPNNPATIGSGITAIHADSRALASDIQLATRIFQAVGEVILIENEELMNAVTGLSGSGPAYVYIISEALSDAGVKQGLTRPQADLLATHTLLGAARMLVATKKHPAELKNQVTSPGGTTIAGIEVLEARGLRSALIEAVAAATRRSQELENLAGKKPR